MAWHIFGPVCVCVCVRVGGWVGGVECVTCEIRKLKKQLR